jgi:hypothetical protein
LSKDLGSVVGAAGVPPGIEILAGFEVLEVILIDLQNICLFKYLVNCGAVPERWFCA